LVAFQVGDTPIYYDVFTEQVQNQRQQALTGRGAAPDVLSPIEEAQIEASVLNQYITSLGTIALAKKVGIKFTDAQITQALNKDVESQITAERSSLVSQKKLKADATAADFDAALKKDKLPTVADIRKRFHDEIAKDLKDPKTRPGLEEQVARPLVMEALQASIKPTLDQLKAQYDTYQFKRILFVAHPGSTVDSQIAKAQADIKSGASFEQVIDRYSGEPPIKGKKLSDNTIDTLDTQFDFQPELKPLKSLKPGQVSDVIETPQGKAIYKLIALKNTAPPDLATNTKKYADTYAMQKASTEFQDQLKQFSQSGPIVWKIQGLKALYDWLLVRQDFMLSPADQVAKMGSVVDEAKKAMTAAANDTRPAALAWFAAFDTIWNAPGADKIKLRGDRIEVLKALTTVQPFFSLRMELVDLLMEAKDGPEAVEALKNAAGSNFNYDIQGQQNFQDVQARMMKLSAAGMLSKAQEDQITKIQQEWVNENAVVAKDKAAMKAEQEKAQKETEENAAKQKAEALKQKAEAEKAAKAAGAAPPGTTPAAPGPAKPGSTAPAPPSNAGTAAPPPAAGKK
jgi:hypothetical protein